MLSSMYESLLISIIFVSWAYTLRTLYVMNWERPSDARNLAEHCSKYVLNRGEFSNEETLTSGNAHVVSRGEYRGRTVILKRWHGATVPHESRVLFAKRLVRDLDQWRALDHPNIGPILGVALHISNLPALVVPYYRTVSAVLAGNPETDVLNLMRGVAAGLSYLHAQKPPITHGDLKGSTVFVSPAGTALLSDIGISAIPQPPDWGFHGVDDARWQAPEIMDPKLRPGVDGGEETFERTPDGGFPATRESDVYSFGMLAYEMHARAWPFASAVWAGSVVIRVVTGARPPRPPLAQSPQLTDALWELIQLCWAQDWRRRPHIDLVVASLGVISRVRALEGAC
ncbi:kinase-like domain-containing protein [Mycena rosella]|uniref:Kinase-like domain-containing protein n=1 Tax=Mycena rosella TaxID=1033263 RepID=A0AAD7G7H6_MYCRO|nr:kinase-like domain-containing protein [Mycena rosella]